MSNLLYSFHIYLPLLAKDVRFSQMDSNWVAAFGLPVMAWIAVINDLRSTSRIWLRTSDQTCPFQSDLHSLNQHLQLFAVHRLSDRTSTSIRPREAVGWMASDRDDIL